MFCPRCGAEYRKEITLCSDCGVTLVTERPVLDGESDDDLMDVFNTSDVSLLPVVKSVLEAAGIPFIVQGDEALGVLPVGRIGAGGISANGHGLAATVLVPRDRQAEAEALLDNFSQPADAEPQEDDPS